jgi:hypothetical protein
VKLYYEWGFKQLYKHGEELCGDSIAVSRSNDSITLALSDGLGSGVKANILATLTTKIAMHLLENELALGEVVQTLTETLPVCEVRKLAYSTFALAQFFSYGVARIVEFDSPEAIHLRNRISLPVNFEERSIDGKTIHEAMINLEDGDWVVFVSDGVLNAGIGGVYPLGWGWELTAQYLEQHTHQNMSAADLASNIAAAVGDLYAGSPGDDVSIIVIKVRKKRVATVLTGPPIERAADKEVVTKFTERTGKLAVCGGTTAKIVSKELGRHLDVDLSTMNRDVPPMGKIDGIDLVSEGILTLTQVEELLRRGAGLDVVKYRNDGAASLLRLLLEADFIHFFVGQAVNPAHQNPDLPDQLGIRQAVVRDIVELLEQRDKEVYIEHV